MAIQPANQKNYTLAIQVSPRTMKSMTLLEKHVGHILFVRGQPTCALTPVRHLAAVCESVWASIPCSRAIEVSCHRKKHFWFLSAVVCLIYKKKRVHLTGVRSGFSALVAVSSAVGIVSLTRLTPCLFLLLLATRQKEARCHLPLSRWSFLQVQTSGPFNISA